ncbi:MAG TPA: hypothetical protein VMZ53_13005 [Kofleriaceae bacterium]|nr:hypothetical protein [Kofleriaceae bacterium]
MKRAVLLLALSACTTFEDPDIVLDFRVLGAQAEIPEQIIDIDITMPPKADDVLAQLVDTRVCWLMSDKNFDRSLRWSATLCNLNGDERCPEGSPQANLGSGVWDDPDTAPTPDSFCTNVPANGNLLGVALDYLENDQLHGLGGIYYGVSLRVGGVDGDPALDLYAAKSLRIQPRIPPELTANTNPTLVQIEASVDGAANVLLVDARCVDQPAPLEVAAGATLRFYPVEPDGVRETYVVPTIDGMVRTFTESLTYQWLATAGNYAGGRSGGTRDAFGNPATLWTDWNAPDAEDLEGPLDVDFWIIQRDERLGLKWFRGCVRVVP